MYFTPAALSGLSALIPLSFLVSSVKAQASGNSSDNNLSGLLDGLRNAGFTAFADALGSVNGTADGKRLVSELTAGDRNHTVFVPNNDAFSDPDLAGLDDTPEELAAVLSYHCLQGSFINETAGATSLDTATLPSVIVGRTLLTSSPMVNLEGGKGQILVWTRNSSDDTRYFLNQAPEVDVVNTTALNDRVLIAGINRVLAPPGRLTATLETYPNASSFTGVLSSAKTNNNSQFLIQILESNNTKGSTFFVPTDNALRAAGPALTTLTANDTALSALLGNHYVNGSTFYSPQLNSEENSLVSASGQNFTFSTNDTGTYINNGNVTARIVKSDALVQNGVVHYIDNVFQNNNIDESKASAAYQSATSTAAISTTETGPIGPKATDTASSDSNNATGGRNDGTRNAAQSVVHGDAWAARGVACFILFLSMIVGGFAVLTP